MIQTFEDFCTTLYVLIADEWPHLAAAAQRPGPRAACSDPELVTMALVGECKGWDEETVLLSQWQAYRHLFPHQPTRTRFNRRRRLLAGAINQLRRRLVQLLHPEEGHAWVIDSLPVAVVQFPYAVSANSDWKANGATYGKVMSKCQTIFGFKLHLVTTLRGVIVDFALAPANLTDLTVAVPLLHGHYDKIVLADKAYASRPVARELAAHNAIVLVTPPKRTKTSPPAQYRYNQLRQRVETVNSQLTEQFGIERNRADSFGGLCARLYTKLTAFTACLLINRQIAHYPSTQVKHLAFPI